MGPGAGAGAAHHPAGSAGPAPTYINLAHRVVAAVMTDAAGHTTPVLDLPGRALAAIGAPRRRSTGTCAGR